MKRNDGTIVKLSLSNWLALITLAMLVIAPSISAWVSINNKVAVIQTTLEHHKEAIDKMEIALERDRNRR